MDAKKKTLEDFIKSIKNDTYHDDWYDRKDTFHTGILDARDKAGSALAHEVLKNTGVPIPSDGASIGRKEDFLNQILNERYPEFKGNPDLSIQPQNLKYGGTFHPNSGEIKVYNNNNSIRDLVKTSLHEAGHKFDDLNDYYFPPHLTVGEFQKNGQIDLTKAINASLDQDKYGALDMYEIAAEGHHDIIPKLRDSKSFELGALKSMLKSGTFKAMGPMGMAANITPSLIDLKEGNPNTAAARMVTGMAPAGTGELDAKLMNQANIADKSPELLDPSYMQTLKNIGERRTKMGKSPVVESFSGQQIDTSATEESDFLNAVKAKMRSNSQG